MTYTFTLPLHHHYFKTPLPSGSTSLLLHLSLTMPSCGASSVGLGRGRVVCISLPIQLGVESSKLDFGPQVQRKVVVCGDGACGELRLRTTTQILHAQSHAPNRQDLTTQCLHQRLLHPSIVRPQLRRHPLELPDPNCTPKPTLATAPVNQQCLRIMCMISMSMIKW